MQNNRPWVRLHANLIHDDFAFGELTYSQRYLYLELLALCGRVGEGRFLAASDEWIRRRLGRDGEFQTDLACLERLGLVGRDRGGFVFSRWGDQEKTTSTERVRKHRDKEDPIP